MKTFHDFLQEMALKSYRTDFHREPSEDEGFMRGKDGSTNTSMQVSDGEKEILTHFSSKDRAVITHPRTARVIEERLKHSEYDFNILFVESKNRRLLKVDYADQVEQFIYDNRIKTEGQITFVKDGTSGHIMTPWMILHTLGHAVAAQDSGIEAKIWEAVDKIRSAVDSFFANFPHLDYPGSPGWVKSRREALGGVFAFRSASAEGDDGSAGHLGEFVHELIAEFLWGGDRIRVRQPHQGNPEIVGQVRVIEGYIHQLLRGCVGKIIYDVER